MLSQKEKEFILSEINNKAYAEINNQITRNMIISHLYTLVDVNIYNIVCDESNNPPQVLNNRNLIVDLEDIKNPIDSIRFTI